MSEPVEIVMPSKYLQEAQDLDRLIRAVDKDNPSGKDLRELEKQFRELPGLWELVGDVNRLVQQQLVKRLHGQKSSELAMLQGTEHTRLTLGYEQASQLERMLIDHVVTCWLRMQDMEWRYYSVTRESIPIARADYWERRLSATQRRYLRACETLARVRKLIRRTPAIQVNIAAAGGQQVNVVQTQPESGQPRRGEILEACEKTRSEASG